MSVTRSKRTFGCTDGDRDIDAWFDANADALLTAVEEAEAQQATKETQKRPRVSSLKVISGGQTGADRAALEAAREVGIPTGGVAPLGFTTSAGRDLALRDVFGLVELPLTGKRSTVSISQMYVLRSQRNVDDCDVTVAFRTRSSAGTDKTVAYCRTQKWAAVSDTVIQRAPAATDYRPCLVITNLDDVDASAATIASFISAFKPAVVNVCGHRDDQSSGVVGFGSKVRRIMASALRGGFHHAAR